MEALACGCPAVVSDISGNREWVEPERHGWWFEMGDITALKDRLLHAVVERDRLPVMGKAARELAERRADWSRNFPQLMHAYELARSSVLQGVEG
jgi:glycosyltransferase involved in cell wall biosynthesis